MTPFAQVQATRSHLVRADIVVIAAVALLGFGLSRFLQSASSPFLTHVDIQTSLWALPGYALLSLTRSLIALAFSLVFAVLYGTLAANSKTLEKILIPLLDVLQSLPVLAFLPGFVLALISVFQNSRWGLEFACLITIFAGQVWNLVFAYYESQKTKQPEFDDVARVYQLSGAKKFFFLDLPNGYRPLVYNGMMSMAGGWFFLTTCEDFPLGDQSFVLPGLGSYLARTFSSGAYSNFAAGLVALMLLIVGTDLLLWKPLVAFVSRFQDSTEGQPVHSESSWLLSSSTIPRILLRQVEIARAWFIILLDRAGVVIEKKIVEPFQDFRRLKYPPVSRFVVPFIVGGLVFSLLPKLPALGESLGSLTSNDWFVLIHAVFLTALKVFFVIIFATLWTLPVGLYLGLRPRLESKVQPFIQNFAAFPAPVLFPLVAMYLVHWHFNPFLNTTFLMCLGSQWYILFNVISGASAIPAELKLVAKIYKLNWFQKFNLLYFPAILPSLTTGWITAAGGAWNASMVAEVVSYPGGTVHSEGIGAELAQACASGNYPRLIGAVLCTVVALVIINRTIWGPLNLCVERVKE